MNQFRAARLAPEKAVFRPALPPRLTPGLFGADMGKMSYSDQLKHPNWQRRRLERLEAAEWMCEHCEAKDATLHVHHKQYFKGRMAWEYSNTELAVLCERCHQEEHGHGDLLKRVLADAKSGHRPVMAIAAGLVAGYMRGSLCASLDGDIAAEVKEACQPYFDLGVIAAAMAIAPRKKLAGWLKEACAKAFEMDPAVAGLAASLEATPEGILRHIDDCEIDEQITEP